MSTTEATELRRASRRLAVRFATLIVVLFALLGAVVFVIVSASQAEATTHSLIDAEHIDSPTDASPGTFVAILQDGRVVSSRNAPHGLLDTRVIEEVAKSGTAIESNKTVAGRNYAMRTDSDSGRVIQVAVNQRENSEEIQRLALALTVSGVLAAIGASFVAAWIARRSMRPIVEALALQRRFVADASHELRTPLTLLSTRAQILRRRLPQTQSGAADSEIRSGVDEIVQDARALTEILEDLLIAADPRETATKTTLDLGALADEIVATLQTEAATRQIDLVRTGTSDPVLVNGARVSLHRLFVALIVNALDHAVSHVAVEVSTHGNDALIRVRDDGPGFPAGMDEHAFDRFASSRANDERTSESRHYGLGLALVADVAARHGGRVDIDNSSTPGAVLVARIPLAR
jgi:Signal transduction histidine kinase